MAVAAPKQKKISFQSYCNGVVFQIIKATDFEAAKVILMGLIKRRGERDAYYELRSAEGRLVPII